MVLTWKANYDDGSFLKQYNADGSENKYTDIDRSRLVSFELLSDDVVVFRLFLEEGQRLIFRRRIVKTLDNKLKHMIYLVGWQQTINGKNVQSISYIFDDGLIVMAGNWKDCPFNKPELLDCEK